MFVQRGGQISELTVDVSGEDRVQKKVSEAMKRARNNWVHYAKRGADSRKETLRQQGRLGRGKRRGNVEGV